MKYLIMIMMLVTFMFIGCGDEKNVITDEYSITYAYTRDYKGNKIIQPTNKISESDKVIINFESFKKEYVVGVYGACVLINNNDIFNYETDSLVCDSEISLKSKKVIIVEFNSEESALYIKIKDEIHTIN